MRRRDEVRGRPGRPADAGQPRRDASLGDVPLHRVRHEEEGGAVAGGGNLSVREAREALRRGGVDWTESWIRAQIWRGKIRSARIHSSRVIPAEEVERIIEERRKR